MATLPEMSPAPPSLCPSSRISRYWQSAAVILVVLVLVVITSPGADGSQQRLPVSGRLLSAELCLPLLLLPVKPSG